MDINLPLMTWPTPILVWKSPRPTELSNLRAECGQFSHGWGRDVKDNALLAPLVGCRLVVEVAGVFHGDGVASLGLVGAVAGSDQFFGDAHLGKGVCVGSGVLFGDEEVVEGEG